jgi:hypothetical protein
MNLEIGTEVALFPEKEYINGIFVGVQLWNFVNTFCLATVAKATVM